MRFFLHVIGALLVLSVLGCSDPVLDTVEPAGTGTASEGMIAFPPVPIPYTGKGEFWDRELLTDSLLTNYTSAPASGITGSTGGWHTFPADAAASISHKATEDASRYMLEFAANSAALYVTQTTVPLEVSAPGAWIIGTMEARSATPNELGLTIGFTQNGAPVTVGSGHPGDGEWHTVSCAAPLFTPQSGLRLTASIVKRAESSSESAVRSVSLRVVQKRPEEGERASLLINGSFEDYAFADTYYPWISRRWGGQEGESVLAADDANHFIVLRDPPPSGGVALTQQIIGLTDADKGRTLTVSAEGTAGGKTELIVMIRCMKGGEIWQEYTKLAPHPGDGTRKTFSVSVTLPQDRLPDEVFIDVYRKRVTNEPITFDNVTFHVS